MRKVIAAGAVAALFIAGAALAEPMSYAWTGMGINVQGSAKCSTNKMTIDVTVDGPAVKGRFQQHGRDERHFEAKIDDKGAFKTKAQLGGGSTIDVKGTISGTEGRILLDGYCKFEGKLTRK